MSSPYGEPPATGEQPPAEPTTPSVPSPERPASSDGPPVVPQYGPPPMPPFGRPTGYVVPPEPAPYASRDEPTAYADRDVPGQAPSDPALTAGYGTGAGYGTAAGYGPPPGYGPPVGDEPWLGYGPPVGYGAPPEDPRRRGTLVASVLIGLVVAAAGLVIGVLWAHLAPRVGVIRLAPGFVYADAEPEEAFGADIWFGFVGLGAGLVFTLLAWTLLRRYRGVSMMIALVLGSLVGAWLAWWIGIRIGRDQFDAIRNTVAIGDRVDAPLRLRLTDLTWDHLWPPKATGMLAVQALTAAVIYTMLAGFSAHPGLRPPSRAVSSDPAGPGDPPA